MKTRVELNAQELLRAVFDYFSQQGIMKSGRHYTVSGPFFSTGEDRRVTGYGFDVSEVTEVELVKLSNEYHSPQLPDESEELGKEEHGRKIELGKDDE